jgi:hypothetical protein
MTSNSALGSFSFHAGVLSHPAAKTGLMVRTLSGVFCFKGDLPDEKFTGPQI